MKFELSSADFSARLRTAGLVINSKATLPILSNFHFKVADGRLVVAAADMDTAVEVSVPLIVSAGGGEVCLPSKLLLDTLSAIPNEPLSVNVDEASLKAEIRTRSGVFNFMGQSAAEFPKMAGIGEETLSFKMSCGGLHDMLADVAFAASDDELRPVMCCVFVSVGVDGAVEAVATDGHRLAISKAQAECSASGSLLLGKKAVALLRKMAGAKRDEPVSVRTDGKRAEFVFPNFRLVSRLTEGVYFNYKSVVREESPRSAVVDRTSLLGSIRRAGVYSCQSTELVRLDFADGGMTVSAQDYDFSTSFRESVACQYEGEPMTIGLKCGFLEEMLASMSSESIALCLQDAAHSMNLKQTEDSSLLYLLMPMQLPD